MVCLLAGAFYIDDAARVNVTGTLLCDNDGVIAETAIIGEQSQVVFNPRCCSGDKGCISVRAVRVCGHVPRCV